MEPLPPRQPGLVQARAPYGRDQPLPRDEKVHSAAIPCAASSYYGKPALKPSHYNQLIAAYLFVGGMAGASQVIAAVADRCGARANDAVVRHGRYLSLAGAVLSPVFLIADLYTPARWYNMLRIFRPTSAMSIGSWTLAAFGGLTTLTAVFQWFKERSPKPIFKHAARAAALPAAAAGAVMATYTGTLLGASSTPLWARSSKSLPALFGLSGTATAAAALALIAHWRRAPKRTAEQLDKLALLAATAELALSQSLEWQWDKARRETMEKQPTASQYRIGYKAVGLVAPIAIQSAMQLSRHPSTRWSILAALATLAGGYCLRSALLAAGNRSAKRPEENTGLQIPKP